MRGDQLSRQWRILRQLEVNRHVLTASEIAEMSGISLRTAYRDLDDLQLAGFPLYPEKREGCQCWKFVDTYKSNLPFPFTYTERKVEPYKIWFYEGTIYIIGLCHLRNEIRTFVLDRIHVLKVTDETFKTPKSFDFQKYIRHGFKVMHDELYTVRILISPTWARS